MGITPPLRYIHIDDYSPVGIDNGPDDAAFANARADLAAYGYHMLVIGRQQYWLQNGFNLNSFIDYSGIQYPKLTNVLITSDCFVGDGLDADAIYCGLPGTIILSPGFADPSVDVYLGGSEPCRTTSSIRLADSCGITNLRIMTLAAYNSSRLVGSGLADPASANRLVWNSEIGMASLVPSAEGMLYVPAGAGTAIQIDGDYCYLDNLVVQGFRNAVVSVPQSSLSQTSALAPRIGWLKGDFANGARIDYTAPPSVTSGGTISGPISQGSLLTTGGAGGSPLTVNSVSQNGSDITSSLATVTVVGPLVLQSEGEPPALNPYVIGMPLKVNLSASSTGEGSISPYNGSNRSAAGVPSNRYDSYVQESESTVVPITQGALNYYQNQSTVVLELPSIPISSFFDVSSSQSATFSASTTLSSNVLTVASSGTGMVAAGQFITAVGSLTGVSPGTYIQSIKENTGTSGSISYLYTLSGPATMNTSLSYTFSAGVATAAISTPGAHNLGLTYLNVLGSPTVGEVFEGQLISGSQILPGSFVTSGGTSSGGTTSYALGVAQLLGPQLIDIFNGAVVEGSISGTTLTISDFGAGAVAVGQVLLNSEIPPGTTISSTTGAPNQFLISSSQSLSSSTIGLVADDGTDATIITGSLSSTGAITTLSTSGSLSIGQALSNPGIQPGSYVQAGSAGSYTIDVLLSVGTPNQPVAINVTPHANAAVIAGSIGAVSGGTAVAGSTLTLASTIAGSLALPSVLVGAGIGPDTYLETLPGGGTTCLVNNSQLVASATSPEVMQTSAGAAIVGSISGTLLTILSTSSSSITYGTTTLLAGSGVLPGTKITSSVGSMLATLRSGLYAINAPLYFGSSSLTQTITVVPSTTFLGSISGTILSVSPTGTLAPGQFISGAGLSAGTSISGTGTVTSSGGTVTYQLTSSATGTEALTASPTRAIVVASIGAAEPTSTLTVSSTLFGSLSTGLQITGPGITAPTWVTGGSSGTFTLSEPWLIEAGTLTAVEPIGAQFVGSVSGTTLTVLSVSSGVLGIGHVLIGASVPDATYVAGNGTITSGTLTYPLSGSLPTINSEPMASIPAPSSFIGTLSGTTLTVANDSSLNVGAMLLGSGISANTSLTSVGGTILVSVPQMVGNSLNPETITAVSSNQAFPFIGNISGSSLTGSIVGTSTLAIGQQLLGFGIPAGTSITSVANAETLATVATSQMLAIGPMNAIEKGAAISGSISGTIMSFTTVTGTVSQNDIISGPGIPVGTAVTSTPVLSSGTYTCSVGVPQYLPSSNTINAAGNVAIGSISGTVLTVGQSSSGSVTGVLSGQVLYGAGLLLGSNIVSTAAGPTYSIAVPQSVASQTVNMINPISSSDLASTSSTSTILGFNFTPSRPGRLIELNNANGTVCNNIRGFDSSTAFKATDTIDLRINVIGYDGSNPDTVNTVIDLQGGCLRPVITGADCIDFFTFLNNQTAVGNNSASGLSLIGCRAGSSSQSGTLINHSGGRMNVSAGAFSGGSINLLSPQLATFTSTEFSLGGGSKLPTQLYYGIGVYAATFDNSCQHVPAGLGETNAFASPGSQLFGALSAAIGGQLGSDLGRSGYLVLPSANQFASPGDRQAALTTLGGTTTSGTTTTVLTSDGNAILSDGANSLVLAANQTTFGRGYVVAYNSAGGSWAIWPNISFLMTPGSGSTATISYTSNTGTTSIHDTLGTGSATWTLEIGIDTGSNCLEVTATAAGSYTVHWLFGIYCLDLA